MGYFGIYENYEDTHEKIKLAVSCIESNSSTKLSDDVSRIKRRFNLSISSWQDSAKTVFEDQIEMIKSNLEAIIDSITMHFSLAEKTYVELNNLLEQFKWDCYGYSSLLYHPPQPADYQMRNYLMKDGRRVFDGMVLNRPAYMEAVSIYNQKIVEAKAKYLADEEEVLALLARLKEIDSASIKNPKLSNLYSENFLKIYAENKGHILMGKELYDFKKLNSIPLDEDIYVLYQNQVVNGVDLTMYYVYDDNAKENHAAFQEHSQIFLNTLAKIDAPTLEKLKEWGTHYIFFETPNCEVGSRENGYFGLAAYYQGYTKNITVFDIFDSCGQTYFEECALHESGHAIDHAVGTALGVVDVTQASSFQDYPSFRDIIETSLQDELQTGQVTREDVDRYKAEAPEYFADIVRRYYLKDITLEENEPEMYAFIQSCLDGTLK